MSEAVYRALSGRGTGPDREMRGLGVSDMAREVRAAAGSQKAAAAQLGVNVATFRRWESGAIKAPKGLAGLAQAARAAMRRARMSPGKEARLRGKPNVTVGGEIRVSNDTRNRTVQLGGDMPRGTLGPVVDAYLRGDDAGAAAAMEAAIGVAVTSMTVGDVDSLKLGGR